MYDTNAEWLQDYSRALNRQHEELEMTDMTQFATGEGKDLKAKDFVGKNLKVKIAKVEIRQYPEQDDQPAHSKPALHFEGKEKTLVLNPTNTKTLLTAYGTDSDQWVGHTVGLSVKDYTDKGFGHGWVVTPLDVKVPEFEEVGF